MNYTGLSTVVKLHSIDDVKRFVSITEKFKSDIDAVTDKIIIDAKSFIGLANLELSKPIEIRINSDDANEVLKFFADMEEFKCY